MKLEQSSWSPTTGWRPHEPGELGESAELVLVFGATELLRELEQLDLLARVYPNARITGCSTAGEISDVRVEDGTLSVTAMAFDGTHVEGFCHELDDASQSLAAGARLARALPAEGLAHVFVLSDGLNVNGSELVKGLASELPPRVRVTGGLSGDGARFQETFVLWEGRARRNAIAAIGLYGDRLRVGCGCLGGWDSFGPERRVTRSRGNVLYELDGRSALQLYREYLGEHAAGLPATGLLFPLAVRLPGAQQPVVRTILSIDPNEQSLTFAGDVPEGSRARLMRATYDRLVDGAIGAARSSQDSLAGSAPELAILISCVGRKLVLKQRVEEEVEGVRDVLGPSTCLTGFYSYGEISPFTPAVACDLHNQTMTITTLSEH